MSLSKLHNRPTTLLLTLAAASAIATAAHAQSTPIQLAVDASEAPRGLWHIQSTVPAAPGPLTLVYPEWIPGHHRSAGPILNIVGLKLTAAGKPVTWRRDDVDMFAIHCDVPAGATALEARFDYVSPPGSSLETVVTWNELLLYPKGKKTDDIPFTASLKLPPGWKYATALPLATERPDGLSFKPVSLTTLVDSPVLTGQHFKTVPINPGQTPAHFLDMAADSEAALDMKPDLVPLYGNLVNEAGAIFGARHYTQYHWLLTLNPKGGGGLEHHESSDNHGEENSWLTDGGKRRMASLLAHEYIHSWCGKYRRPAGLATPDFQEPMKGELLWVYEGLTEYLATILCPRAGLISADEFHDKIAETAAGMDYTLGRSWRPLLDTTVAAPILYVAPGPWRDYRRATDFYPEGVLLWLQVDVMLRQQSAGKKSMNDFCQKFFGGQGGAPALIPYTLDDVVKTLNEVSPYDWKSFLNTWLTSTDQHMPLAGVLASGWKIVYTDTPTDDLKYREGQGKVTNLTFSLGLIVGNDDSIIRDIIPGMAADKAGVAPGMKLVAVNGRKWTPDHLKTAIKESKSATAPIELLVENTEFYKTYSLNYHDGPRYPHLERDAAKPDVLSDIAKPMVNKP